MLVPLLGKVHFLEEAILRPDDGKTLRRVLLRADVNPPNGNHASSKDCPTAKGRQVALSERFRGSNSNRENEMWWGNNRLLWNRLAPSKVDAALLMARASCRPAESVLKKVYLSINIDEAHVSLSQWFAAIFARCILY
jgi:hypothetical protein